MNPVKLSARVKKVGEQISAVHTQIEENKAKITLIDQAMTKLSERFENLYPKIEEPEEIEYEDFNDDDLNESFFP
jgi:predicted nuclease with TOPRIM domain